MDAARVYCSFFRLLRSTLHILCSRREPVFESFSLHDAPESWKKTFAPHLFGDLYGNGCGFLNKSPERRNVNRNNDNFPFPLDAVAAVADFDVRLIEGAF